MRIRIKRIYDKPDPSDGTRILVDRLWPRGIRKDAAQIAYWARDVAPSDELRRWYAHEASRWHEFRRSYFKELDANPDGVEALRLQLGRKTTLVFGSKEPELNNAAALREYLLETID